MATTKRKAEVDSPSIGSGLNHLYLESCSQNKGKYWHCRPDIPVASSSATKRLDLSNIMHIRHAMDGKNILFTLSLALDYPSF